MLWCHCMEKSPKPDVRTTYTILLAKNRPQPWFQFQTWILSKWEDLHTFVWIHLCCNLINLGQCIARTRNLLLVLEILSYNRMVDWAENGPGNEAGQLIPRYDVRSSMGYPKEYLHNWSSERDLKGILSSLSFENRENMEKKIIYFYLRGYFKTRSFCVELEEAGNETAGKHSFFSTGDILTASSPLFTSVNALECSSTSLLHRNFWAITCCSHPLTITWCSGVKVLQGVRYTWPCPRTPDRISSWAQVHPHLKINSLFPFLGFSAFARFYLGWGFLI